jgi:hypothetical protein
MGRAPKELCDLLREIWEIYQITKEEHEQPELCITVKHQSSLSIWANALGLTLKEFLKPLSMLSLSNMPPLGKNCTTLAKLCEDTATTLNYNLVATKLGHKEEIGIRYAHQTCLVLRKKPLGESPEVSDIIALQNVDACIGNLVGRPCGAGIHFLHVWPGGIVTGCPYDSNFVQAPDQEGYIFEEICKIVGGEYGHASEKCKLYEAFGQGKLEVEKVDNCVDNREPGG